MASSKGGVTPLTETSDPEESTIPEGYWNWKLPPAANVQVARVDSPELLAWSICTEPEPAVLIWTVVMTRLLPGARCRLGWESCRQGEFANSCWSRRRRAARFATRVARRPE